MSRLWSAGLFASLLAGCDTPSTMQTKCQKNDDSVSAQDCYNAALDEGVVDGRQAGETEAYDQAVQDCAALQAGDSGDSADTGSVAAFW